MEYYTLIRHQSLVAALGSRSLPLRLVYAHILGYTQRKGAWQGDVKELATQIELPIQTVRDQLKTLTTMGLLTINGNTYTATVPDNTTTVLTDTRTVQNNTAAVQNPAPIITSNNMEVSSNSNNAQALAPDATTDNNRFDLFKNLYLSINPDPTVWENYRFAAQKEWNSIEMTTAKQDRILRALEQKIPDWLLAKNNPLFYLRDFPAPQRVEMSFNDYYIKNNQDSTPRNGWVMENPTGNKVVFAKYLFY